MLFFFFSSRRRHTRWPRDWSSDVCSSDLLRTRLGRIQKDNLVRKGSRVMTYGSKITINNQKYYALNATQYVLASDIRRSEERRVGKECRYRRAEEVGKKERSETKDRNAGT